MSAAPPRQPRRRPRRGSLERPVSGRTYRGTWLLVALPLLLAAFTVTRPAALPKPQLPAAFDTQGAVELAASLANSYPDRSPGTAGAGGAASWFASQLQPYGFPTRSDRFTATVAGRGRFSFENLVAVVAGRSESTIVIAAHRDNSGSSAGANDNASGTAALIELARSYANPAGASSVPSSSRRVSPQHTLVFLSTDGGVLGGIGAAHFVEQSPLARNVVAVIDLDAIAGRGRARLELAGDEPRSPSATLVATAAARIFDQALLPPERPSALRQLLDLAFPFSFYEQAPFLGHGISAVTITSAGDRPPLSFGDTADHLRPGRLGEIGRSAQQLLASLDGGLELAAGTSSYVYLGSRIIHGWAIELVLVAALLPFLAAAVDLFALTRRRRIPLTPAILSLRSRFGFWLWIGVVFELLGLLGFWPHAAARPPAPQTSAGTDWPVLGLIFFALLSFAGWIVARERLLPRRAALRDEELAGHTVALLTLGMTGLLVVAINPFALVFVLPSLHAWLWLPQLYDRPLLARLTTFLAGFAGVGVLVFEFAGRFGLGLDAPWYLGELAAIGWIPVPLLVIAIAWAAASAQLGALAGGRYAPYPSRQERPPLGPIRRTIRRTILGVRAQRRARLHAAPEQGPAELQG